MLIDKSPRLLNELNTWTQPKSLTTVEYFDYLYSLVECQAHNKELDHHTRLNITLDLKEALIKECSIDETCEQKNVVDFCSDVAHIILSEAKSCPLSCLQYIKESKEYVLTKTH